MQQPVDLLPGLAGRIGMPHPSPNVVQLPLGS